MSLKEAALLYAKMGLAVFPLRPKDKRPATENGFKAATTDLARITQWWDKHPESNIGIATGGVSGGLVVIDLDRDEEKGKNGYAILKEWEQEHGELPETWRSITGRGGYHLIYRDTAINRNRAGLYDGIDIRADGGYIVAPPSVHPNGRTYEWEIGPGDCEITQVNNLVASFLAGPAPENWNKQSFKVPEQIPEGSRTDSLVKLVCSLQSKGLSDDAIKAAVRTENDQKCVPLLTDKELEKEVFPALKRYEKGTAAYQKDYSKRSNWNTQPPDHVPELESITAKDLQQLEIPPLEFIVENMIPVGLILLGAPPKSFKSYMCLDMCLCACQGFDFMGFRTHQYECAYMDLESTKRRPKNRLEQILKGREAPEGLHIINEAMPIGMGFEEQLRKFIKTNPKIKMVVVDVFKKIRPPKKTGADPYERDYEDYGAVKKIADELDIAIILVTHTTKMKHPDDPFNELTGSAGTMGSIDVGMVIKKDSRDSEEATLYITGRDLEEQSYKIKFDKSSYKWQNIGTTRTVESMRFEYEYRNSPVVQTIKKLVEQNGGKWEGTAKDLIDASKYFKGCKIYDDDKRVGKAVIKFSQLLDRLDFIEFHYDDKARPRIYSFVRNCPFELGDFNDANVGNDINDINDANDGH